MTTLTKIGNSQGIRIPKPIIKQAQLENVEISFKVTSEGLLLKPIQRKNRDGWHLQIQDAIAKYSHAGNSEEDAVLYNFLNHDDDTDEWQW